MDLSQFYFIPLNPESKIPILEGHSWPIDPVAQDPVRTYEEVQDSDHTDWGVVGNRKGNLLIVDIDLYKMDDVTKHRVENNWPGDVFDQIPLVKTPSGGFHMYFEFEGDNLPESLNHVDIKGDIGKGFCKAPFTDGYDLVQDNEPLPVTEDALLDYPVFTHTSHQVKGRQELPPCIKMAEEKREKGNKWGDLIQTYNRLKKTSNVSEGSIYEVLDESEYPTGKHTSLPPFFEEYGSQSSYTRFEPKEKEGTVIGVCWKHFVDHTAVTLLGIKEGLFTCEQIANYEVPDGNYRKAKELVQNELGIECDDPQLSCEDVKKFDMCPRDCGRRHPLE